MAWVGQASVSYTHLESATLMMFRPLADTVHVVTLPEAVQLSPLVVESLDSWVDTLVNCWKVVEKVTGFDETAFPVPLL